MEVRWIYPLIESLGFFLSRIKNMNTNPLTINDMSVLLSRLKDLMPQINGALQMYLDYHMEIPTPLIDIFRKHNINECSGVDGLFVFTWERCFKDRDDWYGFELVKSEEGDIADLSFKRNDVFLEKTGDAEIAVYEVRIPIGLIIDTIKYIEDEKIYLYRYIVDIIAQSKKVEYQYQMLLDRKLGIQSASVERDLHREKMIIKDLEPFLGKL